jgi:hypothetical protein
LRRRPRATREAGAVMGELPGRILAALPWTHDAPLSTTHGSLVLSEALL